MIALTTPAPVYWLLDLIQTIGILGILTGVWLLVLSGPRRRRPGKTVVTITPKTDSFASAMADVAVAAQQAARQAGGNRGAGRVEALLAWAMVLGSCAAAWFLIGSFLLGRVG